MKLTDEVKEKVLNLQSEHGGNCIIVYQKDADAVFAVIDDWLAAIPEIEARRPKVSKPLVIPEVLKARHSELATWIKSPTGSVQTPVRCGFSTEVWYIEHIARVEAELFERRIDISNLQGGSVAPLRFESLRKENATLRAQVERLYEALEGARSFQTKKQRRSAAALIAARKEARSE
jgi:hypothetical protein